MMVLEFRKKARYCLAIANGLLLMIIMNPLILAEEPQTALLSYQIIQKTALTEPQYIKNIRLSPSGEKVAFAYGRSSSNFSSFALAINKQQYTSEFLDISSPAFSPDNADIAYACSYVKKETKPGGAAYVSQKLMFNKKVISDYPEGNTTTAIASLTFSPDGKRLAYVLRENPEMIRRPARVEINGTCVSPDRDYDLVKLSQFSTDNKKLAFAARKKNTWNVYLWLNTGGNQFVIRSSADYSNVSTPVFSPDGSRLAYGAESKGKWSLVVQDLTAVEPANANGNIGIEQKRYEELKFTEIDSPAFSPDGTQIAYRAKKGSKWFTMIDDTKKSAEYDYVGAPVFSKDGLQIGYQAQAGKKWFVMIGDQKVSPDFKYYNKDFQYLIDSKLLLSADGTKAVYRANPLQAINGLEDFYRSQIMVNGQELSPVFVYDRLDYVVNGVKVYFAGYEKGKREILHAVADL
jgi:dipeptidyl aminopeptidase/acylaminoacyl peptidase